MVDHREELLRESCALGNLEAVQKFIEAGVDVNSQNKVNKWTALHWSAHRGHFKIVKYLLDHGGDPSITNFDGKTAIDLASNEVKELFGIKIKDDEIVEKKDEFKPNYLLYPELIASVSVPSDAVLRPSGDNPVEKNDSTQSQMYDILVMSINGDLLGSIKVSDSDKITDVIQKLKQEIDEADNNFTLMRELNGVFVKINAKQSGNLALDFFGDNKKIYLKF